MLLVAFVFLNSTNFSLKTLSSKFRQASIDESLEPPGPTTRSISSGYGNVGGEDDYEGEFSYVEVQACCDDWLLTLERSRVQIIAIMLNDNYIEHFGLLRRKAAEEVALLLGTNQKTVRRWRSDWVVIKECFSDSSRDNMRDMLFMTWHSGRTRHRRESLQLCFVCG